MFKRLRGTKDLIGSEVLQWEAAEQTARSVFARYGYEPVRTPIMEETALFSRSVGEVTDIVQKEMYRFEDRSGLDVALRPEGTAGIVRAVIENHWHKEKAVQRLYYYGPMFRAERPQAGRLRQFHQIGAEVMGSLSILSDVEIIEVLVRYLEALGLKGFKIQVNNLGSPEDRKAFSGLLRKFFEDKTNQLCTDCKVRVERNVFRVMDCKEEGCQPLIEAAPKISEHVSKESRENYEAITALLKELKLPVDKNPRIVRGLDYYTDTVFELIHPGLGAQDVLAAGGRYNGLAAKLGGGDIPAVGFALGMERLMIALQHETQAVKTSAERRNAVALIGLGDEAKKKVYLIASHLRNEGMVASVDFENRSMKAHLRQADKSEARFVVIIGEDELKNGQVVLKDMSLSGEGSQNQIRESELMASLKKGLSC